MPYIIALLSVLAVASVWIWRVRNAAEMTGELLDAANDVRLAARRFGFKRRKNRHPVDSIEDARLAGAGIVAALIAQPGLATEERRRAWIVQMQAIFDIGRDEAEELAVLGDWLVRQCQTPSLALDRIAKKLSRLAGREALPDMERMIEKVFAGDGGNLPEAVIDGLNDLRVRFRG